MTNNKLSLRLGVLLLLCLLGSNFLFAQNEIDLNLLKGNWDSACSYAIDDDEGDYLECSLESGTVNFLIKEPFETGKYKEILDGYQISQPIAITKKEDAYYMTLGRLFVKGKIVTLNEEELILRNEEAGKNYIFTKQK